MNRTKSLTILAFLVMIVAQIYVPARMIMSREVVLSEGTTYWFRTAPVDPNDPFRGKYVTLSFPDNSWIVPDADEWVNGDHVYVSITEGPDGYARIAEVSLTEPGHGLDYFSSTIDYILRDSTSRIYVDFPFDRFYMEEFKAPAADSLYREASRDSNRVMLAMVAINQGTAVLQDVILDGVSIRDHTAK